MTKLLDKFKTVIERWEKKDLDYENVMGTYDPDGTEDEQINILMKAERLISTEPTLNPSLDNGYYEMVTVTKKNEFYDKMDDIQGFINHNHTGISPSIYPRPR